MTFAAQSSKPDFWQQQSELIEFRKKNKTFEKSVESKSEKQPYRFYDGPPFITGTPHYGTLLSSICKDVIPRYQAMKGKRVERVRGWDCHGIYIEQKVQKQLGLESSLEIEKLGVKEFVDACYDYTKSTSEEWDWYVDNIGRWVDMKHAYKTQDNDYMESVMRVFKQLRDKKMIYEGKRVSMYSTKLSTPISSFEVAMDDTYEEVNDPAITVMYDLSINGKTWDNTYILVWTTTPWTIPANMAAGVHKELKYAKVSYDGKYYICARKQVENIFKKKDYTIEEEFTGDKVVGLRYRPPYDYYYGRTGNDADHKIYHADFATDDSGTGCVHEAPEFGDVDFVLAQQEGITISEAMDDEGKYTSEINDKIGMFYRDANDVVMKELAAKGVLFDKGSITHRVAFCPRSGTPLVFKAQKSRFIDIQSQKEKFLTKNQEVNWFPSHFKNGRFAKSIESAPDRCVSRTRYWGSPMPVRRSEDGEETMVVGSRDEIYELNKPLKQLTKIVMVRHGQSDYNVKGIMDPEGKAKLTDAGKHQAEMIAEQLHDIEVDAIYASPLQRCIDTITPLAENKGLEIIKTEQIRERQVPGYQEKDHTTLPKYRGDATQDEHGETVRGVYERMKSFLQEIVKKHPGETIVVCSHSTPLKALQKAMYEFDYEKENHRYGVINHDLTKAPMRNTYVFSDSGKGLDLHRPWIDQIQLKSPETGKILKRIPEVLDPWMDSASMPYAQVHYPFENKVKFEKSFPADYIAEYTGQIRAWFYVMHVLGVSLFDKPAYTNVVCTGVMNGNDGRKMSKSYGNYPDPKESIQKYGADAIRMNIINSPVVYGGDTAIKEEGFLESTKTTLLPLWNAFYFFTTYANIDKWTTVQEDTKRENFLDQRIESELNLLIKEVDLQLALYNMQKATTPIIKFLDNLTNRYIRRSRRRFRKSENDGDKIQAYSTMYHVLVKLSQLCAPFMPFVSEYIYKTLTGEESVHLTDFPVADKQAINQDLEDAMNKVQTIVSLGLSRRARNKIRVRQPLQSVTIGFDLDDHFREIIMDELNVKQIIVDEKITGMVTMIVKANARVLGPKYGSDVKTILQKGKAGEFEMKDNGQVQIDHFVLEAEDYEIDYLKTDETLDVEVADGMVIAMDATITPELQREGYARDLVRSIQEARKTADYDIADRIQLSIAGDNLGILEHFTHYIQEETLSTIVSTLDSVDIKEEIELGEARIGFALKR